jgi:hypothetical protein
MVHTILNYGCTQIQSTVSSPIVHKRRPLVSASQTCIKSCTGLTRTKGGDGRDNPCYGYSSMAKILPSSKSKESKLAGSLRVEFEYQVRSWRTLGVPIEEL